MNKIAVIWLLLLPLLGFSQKQFVVFFDFNKDFPNQHSLTQLNQWITANTAAEVTEVSGYCDSVDDHRYNKDLALRRINRVLELLKRKGIKVSDAVVVKPFGKDFNYSKNQEENRKVTFFYTEQAEIQPADSRIQEPETFPDSDAQVLINQEVSALAAKFKKAKKGDLIRINHINFRLNSEKIEQQSMPILQELLQIMVSNPKLKIAIHGHICCNPNGMDTKLSYRRALVIFKYLRDNKIEMNRLAYKGFGSNDPIFKVPERNEAERKANRRVEVLIVEN